MVGKWGGVTEYLPRVLGNGCQLSSGQLWLELNTSSRQLALGICLPSPPTSTAQKSMSTVAEHQDYLRDYAIRSTDDRLSSRESVASSSSLSAASLSDSRPEHPAVSNPPGWDTEHRQVPPYRPVNTQLDHNSRPWGSNPVESVIIFAMMHGVWVKGVSS